MISQTLLAAILPIWWAAYLVAADTNLIYDHDEFEALIKSADGSAPVQTFRTSDIIAPVFEVIEWDPEETDPGYIFLGFRYPSALGGPMIFSGKDLSLVYADQRYQSVFYSDVQELEGTRYLTFWEGDHKRHFADGRARIYNDQYELMYTVKPQKMENTVEFYGDFHELRVTADNTILMTVFMKVDNRDTTAVGGKEHSILIDSGFQEIDPKTNATLFAWAASDHFPVDSSFATNKDFAHVNSVEKSKDGNYLVSSRHMSLLTLVNGTTGEPIWILGGKHNQFKDLSNGMATNIGWQHHARFYKNESHITLFDNHVQATEHCDPSPLSEHPCGTRILHLEIDAEAMTARVVSSFQHPELINSGAMGGVQMLDSGNIMTAWGYNPTIVEYKADGTVAMALKRGPIGEWHHDVSAYRAFKGSWKGMPKTSPAIAVDGSSGSSQNATVYLSWNGATEVATWAIVGVDDTSAEVSESNVLASSPRMGFETMLHLGAEDSAYKYLAGLAMDRDGNVLGRSAFVDMVTKKKSTQQPTLEATFGQTEDDAAHRGNVAVDYTVGAVPTEDNLDDSTDDDTGSSGPSQTSSELLPASDWWGPFCLGAIVSLVVSAGLLVLYRRRRSRAGMFGERISYLQVTQEDEEKAS